MIQEPFEERGRRRDPRHAEACHGRRDVGSIDRARAAQVHVGQNRRHARSEIREGEHRQGREADLARGQRKVARHHPMLGQQEAVSPHRRLRQTGGATREGNQSRGLRRKRGPRIRLFATTSRRPAARAGKPATRHHLQRNPP